MTKQPYLYLLLGVLAGALITSVFLSPNRSGYGGPGYMMNSWNKTSSNSNIDRHFIEQMIPHHEDAITMANSALKKAKKTEIKTLAQNILESQTEEINQMLQWYGEWYGQEVPRSATQMGTHGMMGSDTSMHMGLLGDETDILSLDLATDFDKEFLRQMIPHHQMAVMMATMLENSTDRSEMKQLAKNIITAQNKEIADMRTWYSAWYR